MNARGSNRTLKISHPDSNGSLGSARAALVGTLFDYIRVGYDQRRMTFAADGTVERGRAQRETYWQLRFLSNGPRLKLYDDQRELTCEFHRLRDDSWSGRWRRFEKMPVRLVPLSTESRPRTLLIQQAAGEFCAMLNLSYRRHAEYVRRHGLDFWCIHGEPQTTRPCVWNKILLIRQALDLQYPLIIWLDADTLIIRLEKDLRAACTEFSCIGMCRHPLPWGDQPWHFNAGIIFVRNCELAREFFGRIWKAGPSNHPWDEQARIMECVHQLPAAVQALSNKWNATEGMTPMQKPIIKAWHGAGNAAVRSALMCADLRALEKAG